MLICKHVTALQLGQLVNLNPIDLLGDSVPDIGVPPLNVPNSLGVQFLGAHISIVLLVWVLFGCMPLTLTHHITAAHV